MNDLKEDKKIRLAREEEVSCGKNGFNNTNEHQDDQRMEMENNISFFLLDPPLRLRGFNSPGDLGMFQTATVNKQDYPFGHASKSYLIGAGESGCETAKQ